MNVVDRAAIHMMCAKEFAKNRIKERFFGDERGAIGTIEIIIIVAIVLVIAFFFRDQIFKLVTKLWDNVGNKDTNVGEIETTTK